MPLPISTTSARIHSRKLQLLARLPISSEATTELAMLGASIHRRCPFLTKSRCLLQPSRINSTDILPFKIACLLTRRLRSFRVKEICSCQTFRVASRPLVVQLRTTSKPCTLSSKTATQPQAAPPSLKAAWTLPTTLSTPTPSKVAANKEAARRMHSGASSWSKNSLPLSRGRERLARTRS